MPSEAETEEVEVVVDEARDALLDALNGEFGDAIVETHLQPGQDLWIRVKTEAWSDTADYLRNRQRFRFFNWLSAIDWMPSPYGRSLDSAVDAALSSDEDAESDAAEMQHGVTGGETRFQVLARVHNLTTNLGLTIKTDVPDDALTIGTWTHEYPGAEWHEREVWEMFGIGFTDHPGLRSLYLPSGFEGHPLRKDYPLLARLVKPWPGIVDVEPMPEVEEPSTENAEASQGSQGVAKGNSRNPENPQDSEGSQ